ncbi:MAG: 2OG-Fe(II) oxygenase [Fibrella sp.]|nr:2OG-Fe(II) oxygenase [Armatimonadota bacterium]
MTVHRYDPDIWVVTDALTHAECTEFIGHGEATGFEAATVALRSGEQMRTDLRNNDRATVDDDALATELWQRMKPFAPVEIDGFPATRLNPRFRFYRYESGQQFKRHLDGRVYLPTGEVSRVTLLFYLNGGCAGGETVFGDWGFSRGKSLRPEIRITPAVGSALFFTHELWHEGAPVTAGRKYVLRTDVMYAGAPDTR